jgi:hypothetical protein
MEHSSCFLRLLGQHIMAHLAGMISTLLRSPENPIDAQHSWCKSQMPKIYSVLVGSNNETAAQTIIGV